MVHCTEKERLEMGKNKGSKEICHMYTYDLVKIAREAENHERWNQVEADVRKWIYQYRDLYWYDSLKMVALVATIKRIEATVGRTYVLKYHVYKRILKEWWV